MAQKKKVEPVERIREESQQVTPKKQEYIIAVTEDEYEARRDELEKLDNVVIFMDDGEPEYWFGAQWLLGGVDLEEDL